MPQPAPSTSSGSESSYQIVARDLRTALLQGKYKDQRLPTEAELAKQYGLSRQTIRRAMHDLVFEGMVYRVPGRGTFALEPGRRYLRHFGSIDELMALSLDTERDLVSPLQRRVDVDAAGRLRLDSDTVMTATVRRSHEDTPISLTTLWMPPSVGRLLEDLEELTVVGSRGRHTVIGLLDKRLPKPIAEAEQSITAVIVPDSVAEVLDYKPGLPAMRIDRIYFDADEMPTMLGVSYYRPDVYSYRLRLKRSVGA